MASSRHSSLVSASGSSPETVPPLADILGNWAAGPGPLHRKLAEAIRSAIRRGELQGGLKLPPERVFADQVSVSRTTVFSAWQALKSEGWLESRQGSGTWVSQQAARAAANGTRQMASLRGLLREGEPIDFTTGQLEGTAVITEVVRAVSGVDLERMLSRRRPFPEGLRELREQIATMFERSGVPTAPAQVLVSTGFQQAIALVAALHLHGGDSVVVETPTAPGALDALRSTGARIEGVRVGEQGLDVQRLAELMATEPQLVYLVPTYQNPTGTVIAGAHRRRITRLAAQRGVPVVEDLTHADLGWSDPPPPLAHYDPDAPIISLGSMSKLYWSGLRVGWIRASEHLISRLARLKTVADLGTPVLSQLVAWRLLERHDEVLAERRELLAARLEHLTTALRRHLPEWRWREPDGGIALWVTLPSPTAGTFAQLALRHGVAVLPGSMLSHNEGHEHNLRICFHLPVELIEEGVERLAQAWDAHGH